MNSLVFLLRLDSRHGFVAFSELTFLHLLGHVVYGKHIKHLLVFMRHYVSYMGYDRFIS